MYKVVPVGDSAVFVEFVERVDPVINDRVIALAESLDSARLSAVRDVVPTYRSVAVYFDPLRVDYDALLDAIDRCARDATHAKPSSPRLIRIPVCYGGDLGPDLAELADDAHMSEGEVIEVHSAPTYRVYMLGFIAGFAYMGTVDARIAAPRHPTPRLRVPLGSVGIAGAQTGIYPAVSPGGWRLIGRTPIRPFDPSRPQPFLMRAGDRIQFYRIEREEFDRWPSM